MAGGYWRIASGLLLVPAAVAGLSSCSGPSTATASMAKASSDTGLTAAQLRGALLTRVNGVAAAAPASSGKYSSLTAANTSKNGANAGQVTPKTCAGAAAGFNPTALAASPAAAVTFKVGSNGVSEVLIASSAKTAATALAGHIPAECAKYQAKVAGKTYTYGATEQKVTGIGQ